MARFGGSDLTAEACSEERKIADEVEELMACGFVVEMERREITELGCIEMGLAQGIGELVHDGLLNGLLIDYERILQVASLDESAGEQVGQFAYEAERTGITNLSGIIAEMEEGCLLVVEDLTRESNLYLKDGFRCGFDDIGTPARCRIFDAAVDDDLFHLCFLLYDTSREDSIYKGLRATIEDRHLRCIEFDAAVGDTQGIEGREDMLGGGNAPVTRGEYGTAFGSRHVLPQGFVGGVVRQVNATYLQTGVFGCRQEDCPDEYTRVQTFAAQGEGLCYCMLLHCQ